MQYLSWTVRMLAGLSAPAETPDIDGPGRGTG
jgi:hypothetical protein